MRRPLQPSPLASSPRGRMVLPVCRACARRRPMRPRPACRSSNNRIHVLSRLDPTGYNYHVVEVVRLLGPLDVDALRRASQGSASVTKC